MNTPSLNQTSLKQSYTHCASKQDHSPIFDDAFLLDLAGSHALLRDAQTLLEAAAVKVCDWQTPVLSGAVEVNGQTFFPKLNLRSRILPECRCPCPMGRQGRVCVHALALCMQLKEAPQAALEANSQAESSQPQHVVKHLRLSQAKGIPLEFHLFLPPNLAQTAPRDAMVVKLDAYCEGHTIPLERLNRGRAYALSAAYYQVAGLIEAWCQGEYTGILQLNRERLQALLKALEGQPAVFWMNQSQPLVWVDGRLPGVHECLEAPAAVAQAQPKAVSSSSASVSAALPQIEPIAVDGSMNFIAITLPSRDSAVYGPALDLLKKENFQLDPKTRQWWLRDRHKTLNFLAKHGRQLKDSWGAVFTKSFTDRTQCVHYAKVVSQATEAEAGSFSLMLELKAGQATEAVLRQALVRGQHYVEVDADVYLFDPLDLERLAQTQQSLSGEPGRPCTPVYTKHLQTAELLDAENILEAGGVPMVSPQTWTARSGALKLVSQLQPAPITSSLEAQLRGYQHVGVAWLWHLYQSQLGGILADEMGLGKTVQALALLTAIHGCADQFNPCLVVCPAGLVENWRREAQHFTPHLKVFAHHRDDRLETIDAVRAYDLVITSYSTLSQDLDLFTAMPFSVVIGDEAQHIKNRQTRNAKSLRCLQTQARFLLTGTPIENSLDDLRSLFDFLMPGYLTRLPSNLKVDDRAWYDARLRAQAAPYILRRSKQLVAPELPEKIEQIVYCNLEPAQNALYQVIQRKTEAEIASLEYAGASENQVRLAAMHQLLRLRQVCADPRLLEPKAQPEDSAKLRAFKEILAEAIDGGHRILVFSQFVSVLRLLCDYLQSEGIEYCYLDGQTKDRVEVCEKFNQTPSIPVFLISLKAGGIGLNLTGADTVIHYDPWWNPAVEAQATDRAHRIGQTRVVTSIKLIAASTVEEKVLALQAAKSSLLQDLLDESSQANAKIGLAEIKALLDIDPQPSHNPPVTY